MVFRSLLIEPDEDQVASISGYLVLGAWPRAKQEFFLQLLLQNRGHWPSSEPFNKALDDLIAKLQRLLNEVLPPLPRDPLER